MKTIVHLVASLVAPAWFLMPLSLQAAPLGAGYSLGSGAAAAVRENFDSMGSGASAPGQGTNLYWSVNVTGTERADSLVLANTFPANGGYNGGPWPASGPTPENDRALGVYAGNTTDNPRYLVTAITNNTGGSLSAFYLRFDAEAWIKRNSASNRFGGIQATFSLNNTNFTDLGNTFEGVLAYPELGSATDNYWINGNDPANSIRNIGGLVTGVSIPSGAVFYLRFESFGNALLTDPDGAGPMANRQVGVFLDNLYVGTEDLGTAAPPAIELPSLSAAPGVFSLRIPSTSGKNYSLQYLDDLRGTNWTSFSPTAGTGQPLLLTDPSATPPRRFYRVLIQ